MKPTRFAVVLCVMLIGSANLLHAQTAAPRSSPSTAPVAPDLSKLSVVAMLQQTQTATAKATLTHHHRCKLSCRSCNCNPRKNRSSENCCKRGKPP